MILLDCQDRIIIRNGNADLFRLVEYELINYLFPFLKGSLLGVFLVPLNLLLCFKDIFDKLLYSVLKFPIDPLNAVQLPFLF